MATHSTRNYKRRTFISKTIKMENTEALLSAGHSQISHSYIIQMNGSH